MKIVKKKEITGHVGPIYSVDASGSTIYSSSADGFVGSWDLEKGTQNKFSVKLDGASFKIKVIPFTNQLVIGKTSGDIHVIDLATKIESHFIKYHTSPIFSIHSVNSFRYILVGDGDGIVSVWNADNWKLLIAIPFNLGKIRDISTGFSEHEIMIATQSGEIKRLDLNHFNEIECDYKHSDGVNTLMKNPFDTQFLFSAGKDGLLKVWKFNNEISSISIPAHYSAIYRLLALNSGKNFISASRDKSIKFWDMKDVKVLDKIERKDGGHSHSVNDLAKISETQFCSVSDDKKIIIWEIFPEN